MGNEAAAKGGSARNGVTTTVRLHYTQASLGARAPSYCLACPASLHVCDTVDPSGDAAPAVPREAAAVPREAAKSMKRNEAKRAHVAVWHQGIGERNSGRRIVRWTNATECDTGVKKSCNPAPKPEMQNLDLAMDTL
jgi:hypothetical protein